MTGEMAMGAISEQMNSVKIKNGRCDIDTTNNQRVGHNT